MIAVVTVLLAFPLGYLLRSHLAASALFAVGFGLVALGHRVGARRTARVAH